jgi:HTH-type transcriptional regulator/antitoxin HigA
MKLSISNINKLSKDWMEIKEILGEFSIESEEDYDRWICNLDMLLNEVENNQFHPLNDLADVVSDMVFDYESDLDINDSYKLRKYK